MTDKKHVFKLWPEPKEGSPYGPSAKQRLLSIEDLPDVDTWVDGINIRRPHYHPVDVVCYVGGARCLGVDTAILMHSGDIKLVQDVEVGDLLMGPDSQPRRVESLARGRDQLYKIIPKRGDSFVANGEHILSLQNSSTRGKLNGSLEETTVNQFIGFGTDRRKSQKLWISGVDFPEREVLIDPYWLGVYLGDGSLHSAAITSMDKEIADYIYGYAEKLNLKVRKAPCFTTNSLGERVEGRASCYFITCGLSGKPGQNTLINYLKKYNIIFKSKYIPEDYLKNTRDVRLKILAGLLDSDGYLLSDHCSFEISQKNEVLANNIVYLARSLGFNCFIRKGDKSCMYKGEKRTGTYYRISIFGSTDEIPTLLPRKRAKKRDERRSHIRTAIRSIEPLGEGDYYGFELSGPDRLFLLGNFMVTHNSGKTVSTCAR